MQKYKFKTEVWLYPGMAGWHFLSVPKKESERIKSKNKGVMRGFSSIPVIATIGKTRWKTSIFPDKKSGTYLLPLKTEVRRKEAITKGDIIALTLNIQEI